MSYTLRSAGLVLRMARFSLKSCTTCFQALGIHGVKRVTNGEEHGKRRGNRNPVDSRCRVAQEGHVLVLLWQYCSWGFCGGKKGVFGSTDFVTSPLNAKASRKRGPRILSITKVGVSFWIISFGAPLNKRCHRVSRHSSEVGRAVGVVKLNCC